MDRLTYDATGTGQYIQRCACTKQDLIDRLAYYEDLEEQGRLIVLPCKVGDTVYTHEQRYNSYGDVRNFVEKKEVVAIRLESDGLWVIVNDGDGFAWHRANGMSLFLTREAAEAALGGDHDA